MLQSAFVPTKAKRADGQSSRGASTLLGFADIIMEMSCYRRARSADRRRRICAYSRYEETPRHLVIELNADGNDYAVHEASARRPLPPWPQVLDILNGVYQKLDEQEILDHWPRDEECPNRTTLGRWLKRAVEQGEVRRCGAGHKGNPYRYWLPAREPMLFPGYDAGAEAIEAWKEKCGAETRQRLLEHLGVG